MAKDIEKCLCALYVGETQVRGVTKLRYQCPFCKDVQPESCFNVSPKKEGKTHRCRFCKNDIYLVLKPDNPARPQDEQGKLKNSQRRVLEYLDMRGLAVPKAKIQRELNLTKNAVDRACRQLRRKGYAGFMKSGGQYIETKRRWFKTYWMIKRGV